MNLIELLKAIILGVVEGVTEWLPISSTGHMILVDEFLQLNVSPEFKEMFLVVIQLGAILAVVLLFWNKLWPFTSSKKGLIKMDTMQMWFKVLVAVIPAALIGIPFEDTLDKMFYNFQTVAVTLVFYGILFIVIENRNKGKIPNVSSISRLTYKHALIIGAFQILALIPGTSRSGATILGAMLIGTSRTVAAEFSFFLSIPIMAGASLIKVLKFGFVFSAEEVIILLTGMVVAFVVSLLSIKFLMTYVKKHDFKLFGWYRIVLGIIVILYYIIQSL